MRRLQLVAYDTNSPEWAVFQAAHIEYGYSVFMAWGVTGLLREKAVAHAGGCGVRGATKVPEARTMHRDDAHELSVELMIVAIGKFRKKTLLNPDPARRWSPTGGASIKTYFIGRALMELPDVFERLRRHEQRATATLIPACDDDDGGNQHRVLESGDRHRSGTTASLVEDRLVLDDLFADRPVDRMIFELYAENYTAAEVAEVLTDAGYPMKEGTVHSRISRFRSIARP